MKIGFVELLKNFGVKAFVGLTGWQAWLADFILNKAWKAFLSAWKAFLSAWNKAMKALETKKEIKDELEKYNKVITNPNATEEEVRDAGRDFIK